MDYTGEDRMMNRYAYFMFPLITFFLLSCGGKKVVKLNETVDTEHKGLSVAVEWIKNKRNAIDMSLTFHNGNSHPLHFNRESVKATFNGQDGALVKDLDVSLGAGESVSEIVSFRFHPKIPKTGSLVLILDPIYKGATTSGNKEKLPKFTRDFPIN